jgi:hypothetical protein
MEDEVVFTLSAELLAFDFAWIEPQPLTFKQPDVPQYYPNPLPEPTPVYPVYPVIELPEDIIAGVISIVAGIVLSHTENDVTPLA